MQKKMIASLLTMAMTVSVLTGCGGGNNSSEPASADTSGAEQEEADSSAADDSVAADTGAAEESTGGDVTIKLFSNLPDRKNGQGLVEQMIIDEYMAANPNVTIEVEALDEEAYKTKFKAYAMDGMLADVAQRVGISPGYLSTLFQRQMAKGFVDYLNEIRIEHACTYLLQNYLKAYEIAYKVGFKDEKYFSRVFKKIKGKSPSEYRKQNK